MADLTGNPVPTFRSSETAPIVYFDIVPTYGVMAGAIQIELAGRNINPLPDGETQVEFMVTGRLRCSPVAAENLRDAIDKALEMLEQVHEEGPAAAASKLN